MPLLIIVCIVVRAAGWLTGFYQVKCRRARRGAALRPHVQTVRRRPGLASPLADRDRHQGERRRASDDLEHSAGAHRRVHHGGDLNLAMQYRIKDRRRTICSGCSDPKSTLGEVSESAIREVVGRNDQQAILSGQSCAHRAATRTTSCSARSISTAPARSGQREHHRRAGARGRAGGAARFGQGLGRSRTHRQGSAGLRQQHPAGGRGQRRALRYRMPKRYKSQVVSMRHRRRVAIQRSSRWPTRRRPR